MLLFDLSLLCKRDEIVIFFLVRLVFRALRKRPLQASPALGIPLLCAENFCLHEVPFGAALPELFQKLLRPLQFTALQAGAHFNERILRIVCRFALGHGALPQRGHTPFRHIVFGHGMPIVHALSSLSSPDISR